MLHDIVPPAQLASHTASKIHPLGYFAPCTVKYTCQDTVWAVTQNLSVKSCSCMKMGNPACTFSSRFAALHSRISGYCYNCTAKLGYQCGNVYLPHLPPSMLEPHSVSCALLLWTRVDAMHPPITTDSQTTVHNTFPNCWPRTSGWMILFIGVFC